MSEMEETRCKIKHYTYDGYSKIYTCDEIRESYEEMKSDFRKKNGCDYLINKGISDRAYDRFCDELDSFLSQCTCLNDC